MTDTITALTVRLPLCPDAALSPNARVHWRTLRAAAKELRQAAMWSAYAAEDAAGVGPTPLFAGPVTVRATIGWAKGRKRMDGDNAAAMLKAVWDGFTDAGIWIDDKQVTFEPVTQERDPDGRGYIAVEVEP